MKTPVIIRFLSPEVEILIDGDDHVENAALQLIRILHKERVLYGRAGVIYKLWVLGYPLDSAVGSMIKTVRPSPVLLQTFIVNETWESVHVYHSDRGFSHTVGEFAHTVPIKEPEL